MSGEEARGGRYIRFKDAYRNLRRRTYSRADDDDTDRFDRFSGAVKVRTTEWDPWA